MADFEWYPEEELRNIQKHGVAFATATLIWNGPVFERIDRRRDYGEVRLQAFGVAENRVLTVIFTWQGETRRIISARQAKPAERRSFDENTQNADQTPPD
jgi:uncharacterized DUF497 family protein